MARRRKKRQSLALVAAFATAKNLKIFCSLVIEKNHTHTHKRNPDCELVGKIAKSWQFDSLQESWAWFCVRFRYFHRINKSKTESEKGICAQKKRLSIVTKKEKKTRLNGKIARAANKCQLTALQIMFDGSEYSAHTQKVCMFRILCLSNV